MTERTFETRCGTIHYWTNELKTSSTAIIFLPGLTADHRLFDKQVEYFKERYPVLVWDAPAHAASWPFEFSFNLKDKALWLDGILSQEGIDHPVIVGQSMGGYVGQIEKDGACVSALSVEVAAAVGDEGCRHVGVRQKADA